MNIGSGWSKETENGKKYISTSLGKEVLALFPQLKDVSFVLWYVPKDERRTEDSPCWQIACMPKSDKKKKEEAEAEQPKAQQETVDDEEIPFL